MLENVRGLCAPYFFAALLAGVFLVNRKLVPYDGPRLLVFSPDVRSQSRSVRIGERIQCDIDLTRTFVVLVADR
jgi:hypothetical protein